MNSGEKSRNSLIAFRRILVVAFSGPPQQFISLHRNILFFYAFPSYWLFRHIESATTHVSSYVLGKTSVPTTTAFLSIKHENVIIISATRNEATNLLITSCKPKQKLLKCRFRGHFFCLSHLRSLQHFLSLSTYVKTQTNLAESSKFVCNSSRVLSQAFRNTF